MRTSIDVKFIFDSARLGLSSSADILQIADVIADVIAMQPFELTLKATLS